MATNGKSASGDNAFHNGDPGLSASNLIAVQPPRREDLQPSYAKTLLGESEDAGTHGWYGMMSMMIRRGISIFRMLTQDSPRPWLHHWISRSHSLLYHLPEPLQTRFSR